MQRTSPRTARTRVTGTGPPRPAGATAAGRGLSRGILRVLMAVVAAAGLAASGLAGAAGAGASTAAGAGTVAGAGTAAGTSTAAGTNTAAAGPAGCTRTVTGTHHGGLEAAAGLLCLEHATQLGPVRVWPGARLRADGSTVSGPVTATRARSMQVCRSALLGGLRAVRTAGPVLVGGPGCGGDTAHAAVVITGSAGPVRVAGLRQQGPVMLSGNAAGVTVSGGSVAGKVTVRGNRGTAPVLVAANAISGSLACAANHPAPGDGGRPNTVSGTAAGQCSTLVPSPPRRQAGPPLDQDLSSTLPNLGYGQAVGNFVFDGTDHYQLASHDDQDNALKIANVSKYGGGVLQSSRTDLKPLTDAAIGRNYPWDQQPDVVEGVQVAASASNIYMAGATFDCSDCSGMQLHLYKLPHDGSCAQESCATASVDLPGFSPSGYPMMVTALATGEVGGQTIIAMAVSNEGILLYDDNLHLITTLTDYGPQDQPPSFQTAATALAFGPASGPGEGGVLVAAVANADTQTLLHPMAGWHLNPDGTEQDSWQFQADASWDPTWMELGVTVAQVDDQLAAVYTRTDGDVIVVNADNGSLIEDLPASQRTGLPLGVTAVPPVNGDTDNEDLVVGMNSGTGDKVLQDASGQLAAVPFGLGGAATGTDAQVYTWFPGYGAGRLKVSNVGDSVPVEIAMASRPDPGFGCWLNASVTQPQVPAFPASDTRVDTWSPDYFVGALTAGANGDCTSGQGKGERAAYVIITPVGDRADEHIVKLVANAGGTLRIASQVGGDLTAKLTNSGGPEPGSWGSWELDVQGIAAPSALAQPQVTGTQLTSLPGPNYQPPTSPAADDPCRPVYRIDVTSTQWKGINAAGQVTAQIPPMTAQGSTDNGQTWTDLGQVMPSTAPSNAGQSVFRLGPASFYWQDPPGTATLPTVAPGSQCPSTGAKPLTDLRVVSGGLASQWVVLPALNQTAPPIGGGPGAQPVQQQNGVVVTPDNPSGVAMPRADGVDQAGLTVQLDPASGSGIVPPTDPQYKLVYYRVAGPNTLVTGLYTPGDYADYVAVGPYAAAGGGQIQPTRNFLVTTSTAAQTLIGEINDSGTASGAVTSQGFKVTAFGTPLSPSGTATGGIQIIGCSSSPTAVCPLSAPADGAPVLYQAGGQASGPATGLQFSANAVTARSSLPLQVGTGDAHTIGSAPLDIQSNRAVLEDTSPFWPQDRVDTALVTQGELVAAPSIPIGGN